MKEIYSLATTHIKHEILYRNLLKIRYIALATDKSISCSKAGYGKEREAFIKRSQLSLMMTWSLVPLLYTRRIPLICDSITLSSISSFFNDSMMISLFSSVDEHFPLDIDILQNIFSKAMTVSRKCIRIKLGFSTTYQQFDEVEVWCYRQMLTTNTQNWKNNKILS